MSTPYEIRRDAIEQHEKSKWQEGYSYGRQTRRDAILGMLENQIIVWEAEHAAAIAKYQEEPEYQTWEYRAEQIKQQIATTLFWIEIIKEQYEDTILP